MKVATVVGARPQFIKAAVFSLALRKEHQQTLIHTGQHYDPELSDMFFQELDLPQPDHNLDVGSGSHAQQTGQMLQRLEVVLQEEAPDWVVVFGDTNSTLAAALAAAKLGLPIAHVEAGLRSFDRSMPEEVNRVLTDHCATLLFCPTDTAMQHLAAEGLSERAHLTGDIMFDSLQQHRELLDDRTGLLEEMGLERKGYFLATVHRAANTDDPASLARIVQALGDLQDAVVLPLHPRTKAALQAADIHLPPNVKEIAPVGYLDMLALQLHARMVLTDSGGVQKEAYLLGTPCVTLRQETEWPETLVDGWNVLAGADPKRIVEAAMRPVPQSEAPEVFGDGRSAQRMVDLLQDDSLHGGRID
ncbi:MAG: UDP-N-acetylglucosamine 2-epimerase (non-hydrolyzing) [Chloroflexi bacterium]|nr:UDP-N-acetylglucosamine 2-epimerase (non-hydrolyzing) [Chloroflexota bacterium]